MNKYSIFFILLLSLLTIDCSKKAKNDEEIKVMIVGTWKAEIDQCTFCSKDYHIMEFTDAGRYRSIECGNKCKDWTSADTTGLDISNSYVAFGDSIYYTIHNSKVSFYSTKTNQTPGSYIPKEIEIIWIKPDKLKIEATEKDLKYEKL